MEATAAKLPKGSKKRGILYDITSKMQGIVSVIAPYKESEIIRAEQWDWLPTSSPFYDGNSGFVAVQRQWAINDGKTPEEARFQTEMPVAGRGGSLAKPRIPNNRHMINDKNNGNFVSDSSVPKMEQGGGSRLATRERVNSNIQETRRGNQSSNFNQYAQQTSQISRSTIQNITEENYFYFKNQTILWKGYNPKGTGLDYQIYQRVDINWSQVRTAGDKRFIGKTNAEAAQKGLAPQLSDGNFATLHHLGQKSTGPLVEANTRYHGVGKLGQQILHGQYGVNKPHPTLQPDRTRFNVDNREYWKWRVNNR